MAKRIFGTSISIFVAAAIFWAVVILLKIIPPGIKFEPTKNDFEQIYLQPEIPSDSLVIPKIGVHAPLGTEEKSLASGGWVQLLDVETGLPEVIAIHRYGEDSLTAEEQVATTLVNVNELQVGDQFQIFWHGQKYEFEIYDMQISGNNPEVGKNDLVIYTCLFFNNSRRIFISAKPIF